MVDLHTHILPGVDDGSPDTACSLAMLQKEQNQGCDIVCLTPHFYAGRESLDDFCARRDKAFEKLTLAIEQEKKSLPRLIPASETAYFPGISRSRQLQKLCIGQTMTLLLELPYAPWQDFEINEVISLALDSGLQLVLVHPERLLPYSGNRRKLERLLALPIGLQINAASLLNRWHRKSVLQLLKQAPLPLLGSDCHNLDRRPPNLTEGRDIVEKKLGTDFLQSMDLTARRLCGAEGGMS